MHTHLNGQSDAVKQRRLLNRLIRNLVAYGGSELASVAAKPRKPPRRSNRVLFRSAEHLTDADVDRLIREVGAGRLMAALDRWTQPRFTIAAE